MLAGNRASKQGTSGIEYVDVLIVGTGPAGCGVALNLVKLARSWAGRIVMVDKAVHPREKLCGGGLTHIGQNILARLGLPLSVPGFEVKEVRLIYRDLVWPFYGDPVFRIMRRDVFDHWLVQMAVSLGITVHQGDGVNGVTAHDEYMEVVTEKRVFRAKVLVAADGSRSFVRQTLKWDDDSRVARLLEILTPEDAEAQPEFREQRASFDFNYLSAPKGLQGYYWDFPSYVQGQPFMNRGVFDSRTYRQRTKPNLKHVLADGLQARGRDLNDYRLKGHPIRCFDKNGRFAMPRVILVGDAAGADPLMGEGISFALGHGEVTAPAIMEAFAHNNFQFADYRERLLGHSLFKQLIVRHRLARLMYFVRSPVLIGLVWRVGRWLTSHTHWRDPHFVPDQEATFLLTEEKGRKLA